MFALFKFSFVCLVAGLICALLAMGMTGVLQGVPLAFLEYLPGDESDQLRQLPAELLVAGVCGMAIGVLAGMAAQWSGGQAGYLFSIVVVGSITVFVRMWTHPNAALADDPGFADYLYSYRATALAALAGMLAVILFGRIKRSLAKTRD